MKSKILMRFIVSYKIVGPIASLSRINDNLNRLTADASGSVSEIADVISRDLSLTTRLLRLVNSVFSGLSMRVTSIEEAIFYLGLKQIRQLAMTTQVIDDIETMSGMPKVASILIGLISGGTALASLF